MWTFVEPTFSAVLPAAGINILSFVVLSGRLSPLPVSPAIYFSGYLTLVGFLGFALTNVLAGSGGTGGVDVTLTSSELQQGAIAFSIASTIVLWSAAATRGRSINSGPGKNNSAGILDLGDMSRFAGIMVLLGALELVALVLILGYGDLLIRADRLVGRSSSLEAAIQMIAIAAVVAVGIALFSSRGFLRFASLVLLAGFVSYFVSLGTRRLALVPILLLLAYAISNRGKVRPLSLVAAGVASLLLLVLPLYFRSLELHGLIPHLNGLASFALTPEIVSAAANNVLAGFKITTMTAFSANPIDISTLWISINPISGDSAGWYSVAPTLRLNRFTPFSAIGELLNYGPVIFVLCLGTIGALMGVAQRVNDRLFTHNVGRFAAIAVLGLIFIFVVQCTQYNLRSNIRYLYFAIGLQLVAVVAIHVGNLRQVRATQGGDPRRSVANTPK